GLPHRPATYMTAAVDPTGVGALDKIGVSQFAHAYNMKGGGVGLWHLESPAPDFTRPEFSGADVRNLDGSHRDRGQQGESCSANDECCTNNCWLGPCQPNGSTCLCQVNNGACGFPRSKMHTTFTAMIAHETAPQATIYHAGNTSNCFIYEEIVLQNSPPA